jgi:hypothetical protein
MDISNRMVGCGQETYDSGEGLVPNFCEHGKEPSGTLDMGITVAAERLIAVHGLCLVEYLIQIAAWPVCCLVC